MGTGSRSAPGWSRPSLKAQRLSTYGEDKPLPTFRKIGGSRSSKTTLRNIVYDDIILEDGMSDQCEGSDGSPPMGNNLTNAPPPPITVETKTPNLAAVRRKESWEMLSIDTSTGERARDTASSCSWIPAQGDYCNAQQDRMSESAEPASESIGEQPSECKVVGRAMSD